VCVTRRFDLDATVNAPARARHLVRAELAAVLEPVPELSETVADVELMVSELVSNAVKAGPTPVTLGLDVHHDHLYLSVRDLEPQQPVVLDPAPGDTHGRGLRIVAVLASTWGVRADPAGGKTVWAELPVPAAAGATLVCDGGVTRGSAPGPPAVL
jgi:anti-sigma regulatory factor (Ser/Thr protein kinase)